MKPWELEWHEFEMPDGFKAMYAFDKTTREVNMSVDDDQLPEGLSVPDRMSQCYDHFFTEIFPTLHL